MSQLIVDNIIKMLQDQNITFQLLEHDPTPTSEDSSKLRGTTMEQGRKAMILKGKKSGNRIMVVLNSNNKIDFKKIKDFFNEEYQFEDPQIILNDFGIKIGGIPPIGNVFGLKTYFDNKNLEVKIAAFNCGLQTKSIIMDLEDLIKVVNPIFVDFKKDL